MDIKGRQLKKRKETKPSDNQSNIPKFECMRVRRWAVKKKVQQGWNTDNCSRRNCERIVTKGASKQTSLHNKQCNMQYGVGGKVSPRRAEIPVLRKAAAPHLGGCT